MILYAKPEAIAINMPEADIYNLEFLAFEKKEAYQISMQLTFDEKFTKEYFFNFFLFIIPK